LGKLLRAWRARSNFGLQQGGAIHQELRDAYKVVLEREENDGCVFSASPLPDCVSQGDTRAHGPLLISEQVVKAPLGQTTETTQALMKAKRSGLISSE
jgi:hypothetical protein